MLELLQLRLEPGGERVGEILRLADLLQDRSLAAQLLAQLLLEARHLTGRNAIQEAVNAGEDRHNLLLHRPGLELGLVESRDHPLATGQRLQRRRVELRAELGESLELAERGEVEA